MRKLGIAAGLAAALALPAAAPAAKPVDKRNAAKECKAERGTTDATREAFALKYKNFGQCVSQRTREEAAERRAAKRSASRDCRAEREQLGADAFREKYGTNRNKRNAFGKCVSANARAERKAEDQEDREEIAELKNAAKECDAERGETAESQAAFNAKYGTNKNGKNAFGKCVSSKSNDTQES